MAAAAPARRLLLRLGLGNPPPLPVPLFSHFAPQLLPRQPPPPAPAAPFPALRHQARTRSSGTSSSPSTPPYTYTRPSSTREEGMTCVRELMGTGAEVWADSVKKKRKRKMNKHKLRKLRKRLRRQT